MALKTDTISQTVKRPKYQNSKIEKTTNRLKKDTISQSVKRQKYQNSKNQKYQKFTKNGNHQNTKYQKYQKFTKLETTKIPKNSKNGKTGPESAVALSEVTAYDPKNRNDFANSEKNFKMPGFERL